MTNDNQKTKLRHVFGMRSAEFYAALEGKSIRVAFMDGKAMTGTLIGLDQYDIILDKDGVQVLIPKHSLKYVAPASEDSD